MSKIFAHAQYMIRKSAQIQKKWRTPVCALCPVVTGKTPPRRKYADTSQHVWNHADDAHDFIII
jgi:hypothetical protein